MDEGYIEVTSQGMRLFALGPISITTKHFVSIFLGALASFPLGVIFATLGLVIPGPPSLPLILGVIGLLPGIILALIPLPKRQTNLLVWLYRKRKFAFKTQTFVFDREYRARKNFEVISTWMREVREEVESEV
ncbi:MULTISPECIES: hypothetical protein [Alicyclobacillus]|uniref:Uncharacterized protein n=1 Tax=Alicyclobacillus acidoterrestris (strain ATCC 49025 / DSM 3922 / CIP 106132 / NCIMB 13137 / GD3B) TaxID=1356854 RepID=T0CY65_ALIAG|nr:MULTISPECIES: hypothetical protein [Alicyclobacillus]EPZ44297.1 hypothetical protein N007_11215 [Alicyclobacillus acidoterrestris ATCC 49025]UNO51078.1 hypothetical protein K1I37_21110 [Alicyclobacillus acidoterrestris]GEO27706.1 hypothetical protein AAC03nite_34910 [Alicyclobacillus acidoterrestris]